MNVHDYIIGTCLIGEVLTRLKICFFFAFDKFRLNQAGSIHLASTEEDQARSITAEDQKNLHFGNDNTTSIFIVIITSKQNSSCRC